MALLLNKTTFVLVLLVGLFGLVGTAHAGITRPPNNLGLVGYWKLDEGTGTQAGDFSGNSYTGTLTGGPTWVAGRYGGAVSFDGSNDYISASNPLSGLGTTSISMWVKGGDFDTCPAEQRIINGTIIVGVCNSTIYMWHSGGTYWRSYGTISNNAWHHVVLITDRSYSDGQYDIYFYIDGVARLNGYGTEFWATTWNSAINIGGNGTASQSAQSTIDDVRYYNRILSATEVAALSNSGKAAISATSTNTYDSAKKYTWIALSNGNLTMTSISANVGSHGWAYLTDAVTGKQYVEFVPQNSSTNDFRVGVGGGTVLLSGNPNDALAYRSCGVGCGGGIIYSNGTNIDQGDAQGVPAYTAGDVIGIAVDTDNDLAWFAVNGTWINSGDPAAGTNGYSYDLSGTNYFGSAVIVATGQTNITNLQPDCFNQTYAAPAGFTPVNNRCATLNASSHTLSSGGLNSGLVGHWTFDGKDMYQNVADVSGQGNTGYLQGFTSTTTTIGKLGQALEFDGSNDYVSVSDSNHPTAYTISAWIKPDDVTSANIFVRTNSSGPTVSWSHQLRLTAAGVAEHYTFDGGLNTVTGTTVLSPNTWYHIVGTAINGGPMRLYVNGVKEGTDDSITGTLWTGGDRYYTGSNSGASMDYFSGVIDDVRIYNRALSAAEVLQLYNLSK